MCAWYSNLFSLLFCFLLLSTTSTISFLLCSCLYCFLFESTLKKKRVAVDSHFLRWPKTTTGVSTRLVYNNWAKTRNTNSLILSKRKCILNEDLVFYFCFSILGISIEYKLTNPTSFFLYTSFTTLCNSWCVWRFFLNRSLYVLLHFSFSRSTKRGECVGEAKNTRPRCCWYKFQLINTRDWPLEGRK